MKRLLVVDDEEKIRLVIRKYAEFEGYEIVESENGMEAVNICKEQNFDLIILDVMMPELDGFSTCEEKGYKEISELADTLNYTVSELTKSELLQRELIANVSHDLRTPLTMITAYAEVMRDLPGENTPENLQVIIDEAKRLTELVNDLLDISKLQAGVQKLERKEYNLTESIKSVMKRYAKLVEQQGYDITFEYREPEVWVEADEYKIYQVLYNLVNNAVNYTGEGIAPEQLNHVWDRYYKIDKNHKRAVMGTGLGLSIVKNILQLHDAPFGVITEIGKGSIFWFELKLKFSP